MNINSSHGADAHVQLAPRTNFHANGQQGRREHDSMLSSHASSSDPLRSESDIDDENSTLTSQTLNSDGTPKRPMNAFMIFARRRRPQVSAANHSMRTGEISKILSKEWTAMPKMEKQFYQDQAKHLKDTFNTRYPDYVYRRRPNNSRRKRKPDGGGVRQVDRPMPVDMGDDVSGLGDVGESLTDVEDIHEDPPDSRGVHHNDPSKFVSTHTQSSFSYAYPDHSLHSTGTPLYGQDPSGGGRSSHVPPQSSAASQLPHPLPYSYIQPRSHSYSAPLFEPEYRHEAYESPVARPVPWPQGSGLDRTAVQKSHSFATSANRSTWPRPSTASNSHTLNPTLSPTYMLPTLNSPFYPSQTSSEGSISSSTRSPHPHSTSHSPFSSSVLLPTSPPETDHDSFVYSTSSYGAASGRDATLYSHSNSGPYFSHFQHLPQPSPPRSGLGVPQAYWSRD